MSSIKVAVRVRPFSTREKKLDSPLIVEMNDKEVSLQGHRPCKYTFDYAYWSHDPGHNQFVNQHSVYNDLGTDVVQNAFAGYNACVFAYGQTGSGKTYTMMGDVADDDRMGLIPRICRSMFEQVSEGNDEGTTYRTEVSYLEIYQEQLKDLLQKQRGSERKDNLKVRQDPNTGPYVEHLSKHRVSDCKAIMALMKKGNSLRNTASTKMNCTSSRGHAIFTITFVKASVQEGIPHETVSKIHLVDLAGSERAGATGATGKQLKEGAHINGSLTSLGSVISDLAQRSKRTSFIRYRDSVLTWLLKDSLGGNSRTIMVATISPAEINDKETLSTLQYANRAKNIINRPTVNEDPDVKLIRELRNEIKRLRNKISADPVNISTEQKTLRMIEAKERHLTEGWREKWKEAATILKEHDDLALKRTKLGLSLNSDKQHLVGIDEGITSTGISFYHLKDGNTLIGAASINGGADEHRMDSGDDSDPDIVLKGPLVKKVHCRIFLNKNGSATLFPAKDALCLVNATRVTQPTRLSQGCVLLLGKTNMFRYNDPKEAQSMRQLEQSSSDMNTPEKQNKMTAANRSLLLTLGSTTHIRSPCCGPARGVDQTGGRMGVSHGGITMPSQSNSLSLNSSQLAACEGGTTGNLDDHATLPRHAKLAELSESIENQKNIITQCLESESCPIDSLNEQMSVLSIMGDSYSRMDRQLTNKTSIRQPAGPGVAGSAASGTDESGDVIHRFEEEVRHVSMELRDIYIAISDQDDAIKHCLESDCDFDTLNNEIEVVDRLKDEYSRKKNTLIRKMWTNLHAAGGHVGHVSHIKEKNFFTKVSDDVEQRLFTEMFMHDFEREIREREVLFLRAEHKLRSKWRQLNKELYILKRNQHKKSQVQDATAVEAETTKMY